MPLKLGLVPRGPKIHINYPIKTDENPTLDAFKMVFQALDALGIHLKRLRWVGWRFLGILSSDATKRLDLNLTPFNERCYDKLFIWRGVYGRKGIAYQSAHWEVL
jgi:hypothetical protein